jgi:hypothetical protein
MYNRKVRRGGRRGIKGLKIKIGLSQRTPRNLCALCVKHLSILKKYNRKVREVWRSRIKGLNIKNLSGLRETFAPFALNS